MHMVKVISLSNQAYSEIKALKHADESFSDVLLRMSAKERKASILDCFGTWKMSDEEAISIKKEIALSRKRSKTREVYF